MRDPSEFDLRDEDDVEMDRLLSDEDDDDAILDEADAPLALEAGSQPVPVTETSRARSSFADAVRKKWHDADFGRYKKTSWYRRWQPYLQELRQVAASIASMPWRYLLSIFLALYVVYCWMVGSPLFASPLPAYSGPHRVGILDLEVPLPDGPKEIRDAVFKKSGDPAFVHETTLVTLFYPTDPDFESIKPRYPWVPKPVSHTAKGFAKFAHVDNFLMRPIFTFGLWAIGGSVTIPAEVDAPLLSTKSEKSDSLPVIVFSHGMASSRSDYTHFLGELASNGHIVAAIEHRDGSCPASEIYTRSDSEARTRYHFKQSDLREEMDTPAFKQAQLAFRDAEIEGAVNIVHALSNDGDISNTRGEASNLATWKNRVDLEKITIGGHSYGATGALQALSTVAANTSIGGIILDPGKSSGPLNADAELPILVVHSNSWSKKHSLFYGRPHFDTVRDLVWNSTVPSWFLTSMGTSHPSVTDAPLLEPVLLSLATGSKLDSQGALADYVSVSRDFLHFVETHEVDGLLTERTTHVKYGEWISKERKKEFPKKWASSWEVHVAPRSLEMTRKDA